MLRIECNNHRNLAFRLIHVIKNFPGSVAALKTARAVRSNQENF